MKLVDEDGFEYDEDLFGSMQAKKEYDEYWDRSIQDAIKFLQEMYYK
jgi:hypothetical protein